MREHAVAYPSPQQRRPIGLCTAAMASYKGAMVSNTSLTLRAFLADAPFSMTMSSGFFGFFAHAGVLTVLEDAGLLPRRVSGSSAGALVSGLWAAGASATQIRDELARLRREDFWDMRLGPGLLAGKLFRARLTAILPAQTFEQCRVPLAVSVYDLLSRKTRVLSQGALAPAIQASCTVPALFHPVWHEGRPLLDGGILDRHGLAGMPEGERLFYHHLSSRSPWRRKNSPSLEVPDRAAMTALVIERLPRVGPFRLHEGIRAFDIAARATREALDKPIAQKSVRVDGSA